MVALNWLVPCLLMSGLWHYDLTIDPDHLEALFLFPEAGVLYPGHISCPSGESPCLVGFRGATSLHFPKKSWRIDLSDPGLIGRTRINLDAHYRDLTMMRNHLAMELVRRMGYPAPITRHVTFSVNGENMGVYLETERIDGDFLRRNSLPHGSFFQADDPAARFAVYRSNSPAWHGFSWRIGSECLLRELARLIGDVCFGNEFESRFDTELFLGNMAANLAMVETDAPSKNYFLSLGIDGVWRYFSWDHDATFGNDWNGNFDFGLVNTVSITQMYMHSLFSILMRSAEHRDVFCEALSSSADILDFQLSASLDSVRAAIRDDVYMDPLRQGTSADFENACDSLAAFISARASVVRELRLHHLPLVQGTFSVTPSWVSDLRRPLSVQATFNETLVYCTLHVLPDGGEAVMVAMQPIKGSFGKSWEVVVPDTIAYFEFLVFHLSLQQASFPLPRPTLFVPPYAVHMGAYDNEALPSALLVDETPCLDVLLPGTQIRLGSSLWALPLVNQSGNPMNLSLCHVSMGDPPSRVFFPENLILQPGETLFVASNAEAFSRELPERLVVGDCSAENVGGFPLTLFEPGWSPAAWHLAPPGERNLRPGRESPLITEISYSQPMHFPCGDWIELHNPGAEWMDLSLAGISDSDRGHTVFPSGTVIPPEGFLVLATDPGSFKSLYPRIPCQVVRLGFGLSSVGEDLRFIHRSGFSTPILGYTSAPPWPDANNSVLTLIHPSLDGLNPESWAVADFPGSPGRPNSGWDDVQYSEDLFVTHLRPVPARGSTVLFGLSMVPEPVHAVLLDLAGRMVYNRGMLQPGMPEYTLELPPGLPSGVYFLVVSSGGNTATRKLLWLR